MIDIFDKKEVDLNNIVCHSGGADGSDTAWETLGSKFGVKTKAYSYKTQSHKSSNKVEITDDDYNEGVLQVHKANKYLNRYGIDKYMNLLARNWAQVKYSNQIIAIGTIIKPGEKNNRGYYNKGKYDIVDGGTGYAVMMGILNERPVHVFDQRLDKWMKWSHSIYQFVNDEVPVISFRDFAGIGTRQLHDNGTLAINNVYKKTFNTK